MSKLPGRAKRKRKRPNRKGNGTVSVEANIEPLFHQQDRNDTVSGIHENADQTAGSGTQRTRSKNPSRHIGIKNADGNLSGRPYSDNRQIADGAEIGVKKKRRVKRVKRVNKRIHHADNQALRHVRAPVQRVPDAAYVPVLRADRATKLRQPLTTTRQGRADTSSLRERSIAPRYTKNKSSQPAGRNETARPDLYAALDLGTNNCRLLIALPQERGRFRVIDGFSRIVRLGEGLGGSGRLNDAAMERAVGALKICANKLSGYAIKMQRLIATEACRQAENGDLFLQRVREETGLKLEIIDRRTEAALAAEGCGTLIDHHADAGVLFDIGGGSSELILINRRLGRKRISDQIVSWTSLPVGVVNLSERHGGELVTRALFKVMVDEVRVMLDAFPGRNELGRIWQDGRVHLLGTSGTVTTLAGIHLDLPKYDRRKVDGLWLSDADIDAVLENLLSMNYEQRAASPCVGRERADLVMAGCAILEAIRLTWPSKRLRVADRGLREGILTQLMDRDGAWLPQRRGRWRRGRRTGKINSVSNITAGKSSPGGSGNITSDSKGSGRDEQ